jgi:hypothetical protein
MKSCGVIGETVGPRCEGASRFDRSKSSLRVGDRPAADLDA